MGQRSNCQKKWENFFLHNRQFRTSCRSGINYQYWKQFHLLQRHHKNQWIWMHHKHLETGLRLVRLKIQCQRVAMNKLLETVARSLHDSLAGIPDWLTDFKENLVEQLPATNMEELRAPSHSSVEPALEHPVEVATKKSRKQ